MKKQILSIVLAAAMTLPLAVTVAADDKAAPPAELAAPANVTVTDASAENWGNVLLKVSYDKDEALMNFINAEVKAAESVSIRAQIDWSFDAPDDWVSNITSTDVIDTPNWEYFVPVTGEITESKDIFDFTVEFNVYQRGGLISDLLDESAYALTYDENYDAHCTVDWTQHYMNVRVRYIMSYYPEGTTFEWVEDDSSFWGGYSVPSNEEIIVLSPWSEVVTLGAGASTGETPAPVEPTPAAPAFTDVAADAYYAEPVAWAVENKITTGATETTFDPENTCTRAQILTFLWRAAGSPESSAEMAFTDVADDAYYYGAVAWALENGMIEAGAEFAPNAPCTRSETVCYMWKYAGSPESETVPAFNDITADTEEYSAVAWALENGVTTGATAETFAPASTCTRGQIVTFLWRAFAD